MKAQQAEYAAHDKLFLVRVNEEGNNVFLTDYTIEGETHFGGRLEDDKYEFNITRYFYQLLNNDILYQRFVFITSRCCCKCK